MARFCMSRVSQPLKIKGWLSETSIFYRVPLRKMQLLWVCCVPSYTETHCKSVCYTETHSKSAILRL